MTKIFKNMAPYWYMIVAIVLLLIVQAFGDLSLPQYTSDIIDVGIQNKGVEHILPVKMTEDEYEISQLYMTSKEKKIWKDTYEKKGEYYICKAEDEEKLDQLDDTFLTAIFLNHNMSNVKESQFKKMIKNSIASNPAMAPMKDKIDDMSVDEIGKMLNMKFKSFQEEDDNGKKVIYVDVRPMLYQMKQTGMMSAKDIQKSREEIEKKMNDIGESTLFSTGVAYATKCDKAAGVDIDKIQTDYLWKEGGRMLGIAFMILVAAIGVGFLASKVGASIGRDLRGKIYKKVMGFSNAEMNRFSTASLITRSTNDIQQIQMVTAVMLRLLLYAPIIGIELMLADLEVINNRLNKVSKKAVMSKDKEAMKENDILEKLKSNLEKNIPLRQVEFDLEELEFIKGFNLLTLKPIIYMANVNEEDLIEDNNVYVQKVREYAIKKNSEVITVCAKIEEDLADLSDIEKTEFLLDLGIKESGLDKLIKATYKLLGLATYFTAGTDECRAWTFKKGMKAPECAGIIHSDFERGFIRSETMSFEDLKKYGSELKVKEAGKLRIEGKEYEMQDGDICHFRFNV